MDSKDSQAPEAVPPQSGSAPQLPAGKSAMREWLETIIIALVIALAARHFVIQVYKVEGDSMLPTLQTGDRLLVNKMIYRFRAPQPGEIVVVTDPTNPRRQLIKRVIAVPGERVQVRDGVVYINGEPLSEPYKHTRFLEYPDVREFPVPDDHIYVMGDNRGQSLDSRDIGPVHLQMVHGEAFFLYWPSDRFGQRPLGQERMLEQQER